MLQRKGVAGDLYKKSTLPLLPVILTASLSSLTLQPVTQNVFAQAIGGRGGEKRDSSFPEQ